MINVKIDEDIILNIPDDNRTILITRGCSNDDYLVEAILEGYKNRVFNLLNPGWEEATEDAYIEPKIPMTSISMEDAKNLKLALHNRNYFSVKYI